MNGKVTLITPPDIFENNSLSILLIHISDDDQEKLSQWLGKHLDHNHINIYFYSGELNIDWLLHAASKCEYKFIDIDNCNNVTSCMASYLLSKTNFFYKTNDVNVSSIFNFINQNKITNIETFLEKALNDKIN